MNTLSKLALLANGHESSKTQRNKEPVPDLSSTEKVSEIYEKLDENDLSRITLTDKFGKTSDDSYMRNDFDAFFSSFDNIRPVNNHSNIIEIDEEISIINDLYDGDLYNDIDDYLDGALSSEMDDISELQSSLISLGRKYARDNKVDPETSEINKSFANSEKKLGDIFDEIDKEKTLLNKDIQRIRSTTGGIRNPKLLADLVTSKNSYLSTQLSIIKEMNSITKTKIDLTQKHQKAQQASSSGGSPDISANTIKSLFAGGRGQLLNAVGGYAGVSGAIDKNSINENAYLEYVNDDDLEDDGSYIDASDPNLETGEGYLKYEDMGVELSVIVNDKNQVEGIVAEDSDGNLIPDYPLPDINNLHFDVDRTTNSATDNLYQSYNIKSK